jgi:hypothetical protein
MQELLRDFSLRSTPDVYTQAMTSSKQAAQDAVMSLVLGATVGAASEWVLWLDVFERQDCWDCGRQETQNYVLLHHLRFPFIPDKALKMNGGDDGARTRDLCRDSYAN